MAGGADGEKGQGQHGKHHANGDDQPLLLADDGENHIRVGGKNVLQPAAACALAEQTAGGGGRHGPGLLEARAVHILPHMAPGGEALGDIGLDADGQKARQTRPRHRQKHRGDGAGAHEGDD